MTYIRPPIWPTRCLISGDLSHCIKYMTSCVELRVCLPMVSLFATGRPSSPKCSACSARPANLKCSDCFGAHMFCKACCLEVHKRSPFHRPLYWTGQHYERISLYSLDFVLYLGHDGNPCPKTVEVRPYGHKYAFSVLTSMLGS